MINKKIQKILNTKEIKKINGLKLNLRPSDLEHIYYKITQFFEKKSEIFTFVHPLYFNLFKTCF